MNKKLTAIILTLILVLSFIVNVFGDLNGQPPPLNPTRIIINPPFENVNR